MADKAAQDAFERGVKLGMDQAVRTVEQVSLGFVLVGCTVALCIVTYQWYEELKRKR